MASGNLTLFGNPILPSSQAGTLTDQIHAILVQEIHSGHWRTGERLPSVSTLSDESGISRSPIQSAFDRLRAQGYLRVEHRSGAYLASLAPEGRPPLGTIGVATVLIEEGERWITYPRTHERLAEIQAVAENRNYLVEVKYLPPHGDWSVLTSPGGPFHGRAMGVICLYPFMRMGALELKPDEIPLVFMETHSPNSLPVVTVDSRNTMYLLTAAVIAKGHRHILYCSNPDHPESERRTRLEGHRLAMREAGLRPNDEAEALSLALPAGDPAALRSFLAAFPETTAVICRSKRQARDLIEAFCAIGIQVPGDISVVSTGPGPMRRDHQDGQLTYVSFNVEHMVERCIDCLEEQARTRRCSQGRVELVPFIGMRDSLAEPPLKRPGDLLCSAREGGEAREASFPQAKEVMAEQT